MGKFYPTTLLTIIWQQKTPTMGVLCGSSKREVTLLRLPALTDAPRSPVVSRYKANLQQGHARLNSWYIRKPVIAFYRTLHPTGQIHRTLGGWRTYRTIPVFSTALKNTNSHYSKETIANTTKQTRMPPRRV